MNNFEIYIIKCLTNMHVGSGDASYSIIDNQVQRDVITNFPIINSSSLKGSLKEYLKQKIKDEKIIKNIFGNKDGIGKYKIFSGMLLSIPLRSDEKPFFRATCPRIIKDFKNFIDNFNDKKLKEVINKMDEDNFISTCIKDGKCINTADKCTAIEGYKFNIKKIDDLILNDEIKRLFGQDLIILDDNTFLKIISELPIIARNKLENGESQNLWYEEVVPRESRFYFGVIYGEKDKANFEKITEEPVQIGGNATIGYGYCNIEKMVGD